MSKSALALIFCIIRMTCFSQVPVINSFSPVSGNVGSQITITGTGFDATPANNIVFFGPAKAVVTSASSTSLNVTVPGGSGYEPISVNVNGLTGYSSLKFATSFGGGGSYSSNSFELSQFGFSVLAPLTSWAIADIDGDGKPDIGTYETFIWPPGNADADTFAIYRNTSANGTFSYGQKFILQVLWPHAEGSVFFKDIDGDGKPDAATFSMPDHFAVYRNTSTTGSFSFAPKITINWSTAQEIIWGDFDNDGKTDIGLLNNGDLHIFLNTSSPGNVSFNPVEAYSSSSITKIKTADIDQDGKLDLVIATGNNLNVLRNTSSTGSLSFSSASLSLLSQPTSLFIGDMDGDQKEDIVSLDPNSFSIFKNISVPGVLGFASRDDKTITGYTSSFTFGFNDMDGDTKPDLVGKVNFDSMGIFKNTSTVGSISFDNYKAFYALSPASFGTNLSGFADLNVDGRSDILITQAYDFQNSLAYLKNRAGEPRINSFNPTNGGAGTVISISGYNLGPTNSITIGGIPVSSFNVISSDSVSAVVAAGSVGRLLLTTTFGKDSIDAFNSAVIRSFNPTHGGPFTEVIIKGINFTGASAVKFGGIPASSFNVISDTTISALVNDSAVTGSITVTTAFGTASRGTFFFNAPNKIELCPPVASTIFSVSVGGYAIIKWQVFNGTTYVDITDDIHYSGSNTNTLHLNNIPSSWYGNNYQFVYGQAIQYLEILNSGHFAIKFVDKWIGSVSTAWEDPANWSCGTVPDSGTDVIINSGAVITLNSNTTIRSLSISPGATLTIGAGYNLTILH